jgi:hypothetical protein
MKQNFEVPRKEPPERSVTHDQSVSIDVNRVFLKLAMTRTFCLRLAAIVWLRYVSVQPGGL